MNNSINKGIVLSFAKQALKQNPEGDYSGLMANTLRIMAQAGLIEKRPDGEYHNVHLGLTGKSPLSNILVEAYQYLLIAGYIIPKPQPPNYPNPTFYAVTDLGKRWIEDDEPIPEDHDNFLTLLTEKIPNLDPVIKQYMAESLMTFERRAFFASAVMVGAAAEKAIYLLVEAIKDAVQDTSKKQRISKVIERRGMPTLFELISDNLESLKKDKLPYAVYEGADRHLLSLAESIRVQRNDAVHPVVGTVSPNSVRLSIQAFPHACKKVYDLIDWLSNNKI